MARLLLLSRNLEGSVLLGFSAPLFSANSASSVNSALVPLPFLSHRPVLALPGAVQVTRVRHGVACTAFTASRPAPLGIVRKCP